ncbi:MAG: Clp protease ClpP [Lachnospiraceae bacterium]|nr:Clp protease ClpP [Lachnospiraceae bacterium]
MTNKKYYALETNETERTAELMIFGDITSWPWLESDVSSYNLSQRLQGLDVDQIDVHINSYGGEVAEALAIYNTLRRHTAKVTTYVDGFACSAATIIFMAGDRRVMSPVGNFLVHPASAYIGGNAEALRREADNLDSITEQSITAYMQSITKSRDELVELMAQEKFLKPEEVLEWGFATELEELSEDDKAKQSVQRMVNARLADIPYKLEMVTNDEKIIESVKEAIREEFAKQKAPEPKTEPDPPKEEPSYMELLMNAFK